MTRHSIMLGLVLLVASIVFFTNLGAGQLWDRDEPRNAGCAAEMMKRGDWITPIFNDELRHQKPVLLYWLIMSAYSVFGQNEFAARFWSAFLGVGTVAMTWMIGIRLFNVRAAFIGAFSLATSMMFVVAARAATPDSVLIFCGTLAITIWVYSVFQHKQAGSQSTGPNLKTPGQWFPRSFWPAIGIYAAMSLGVLAKGPVGMVMPTAIIGMFLLIQRLEPLRSTDHFGPVFWNAHRLLRPFYPVHFLKTCWYMRPQIAIATLIVIAGPWYVLVGIQTEGDWLRLFFLNEHWGRATTPLESHSGPWWYYPVAIIVGFFPWSIFIVPLFIFVDRQFRKQSTTTPALVFLSCWVLVQVAVFTIAKTKLPSYVTPCYPALALLTGFFLDQVISKSFVQMKAMRLAGPVALSVSGLAATTGLAFVGWELANQAWWIGLSGLVPLAAGLVALFFVLKQKDLRAVQTLCVGAFLLVFTLFGFAAVAVNKSQATAKVIEPIHGAEKSVAIATYGCLESTWIFYAERPIFEIDRFENNGTPTSLERAKTWHPKPRVDLETFLDSKPGSMILTTDQYLQEVKSQLPENYEVVSKAKYFLKDKELFLLAPAEPSDRIANKNNSAIR